MRVPSDFQIPVTAPRSGVLETLGLKVGETVTAQVVGQNANGSTLVQIGNQQISLNLPQNFPPGTELQFQVNGGGAKLELALLTGGAKPAAATGTPQQPQVIVSSSILNQGAQPGQTGGSANPAPPQTNPAPAQTSSTYPRPSPTAQPVAQSAQTGGVPANAQSQTIALPPHISSQLNLASGQAIAARVATPTPQGQAQITVGGQTIPVTNTNLPPPGTPLQGQVTTQNGQLALVVQPAKTGTTPYPTLQRTDGGPPSVQASTTSGQPAAQSASNPVAASSTNIAQTYAVPNLAQPLPVPNLSQTAAEAVVRQDSVGKLITTITGLTSAPPKDLPSNITQLARAIGDAPLKLDGQLPNADALKDAVARSGVFLEATLARGALPAAVPQGDMKNMLMLLRNALGNWLAGEALPQSKGQKPAPPMRGAPPRPDGQTPQNILPDGASAREVGRQMLAQTESALSRMRLFQLSSLPEAGQRGNPAAAQELHFELPLMLGNQAAMAQFQINRDGGNENDPALRGWQMAFSVHFNVIGAVGAKISFRAKKTGVVVWAENEDVAEVLEEMLPELVDGLTAQGLDLSSVRVRHHAPDAPPAHSGGFVDSVS